MALVTPSTTSSHMTLPRQTPRVSGANASGARSSAATGGVVRSSGDGPKLVLIGEPGSGWRAAFDIVPGMRIMVGRPNHASRNMATVAYLPSRAVSRMHAVITMEPEGVYLTHTKATNLTWRAVDSIWTPMRPGDRAELKHTDTLCFGMAPKTRSHVNKLDTPFLVSIAILPKGESPTTCQFVRKTIHRPSALPIKSREMDPTMQLLMNGLDGLNVSLDNAFGGMEVKKEEEEEDSQPMGKRKRGSADEAKPEPPSPTSISFSSTPLNGTTTTTTTRTTSSPRSSLQRSHPHARSSSLTNGPIRPLPTARAVFGLPSSSRNNSKNSSSSSPDAEDLAEQMRRMNGFEDGESSKKRRVVGDREEEKVYCGDAADLPKELTNMNIA